MGAEILKDIDTVDEDALDAGRDGVQVEEIIRPGLVWSGLTSCPKKRATDPSSGFDDNAGIGVFGTDHLDMVGFQPGGTLKEMGHEVFLENGGKGLLFVLGKIGLEPLKDPCGHPVKIEAVSDDGFNLCHFL